MASIELRFSPDPGHVRTARLVASAVARRAGLPEARMDELRLAVGEACARAVRRCELAGCDQPVVVRVHDGGPGLLVEVFDRAGVIDLTHEPKDDEAVAVALLRGLADTAELGSDFGADPGLVRLGWLDPLDLD